MKMASVVERKAVFGENYVPDTIRVQYPNIDEAKEAHAKYLKELGIVNPTPMNDLVGWIVSRMIGHHTQDAIIFVYGRRGSGKSFLCGYLGERLDARLSRILNTPLKTHFDINNVRSVDKSGTLQMMDTATLKERMHRVFVLDDASITVNARNFNSPENKYINDILTTARIYRHCMIINTIASNQIDSVARSFADIGILVKGVLPGTNINKCIVYHMERSNPLGLGKRSSENIGKYHQITIGGEQVRIVPWYAYKPSDAWIEQYNVIRKENTDRLGAETDKWISSVDGTRMTAKKANMMEQYPKVIEMLKMTKPNGKPLSFRAIARETGLSASGVDYLISEARKRGETTR